MRHAELLRPVLDALVPEAPAAVGRRVRGAAIWLVIASWLLPTLHGLGTGTTTHRALICAAFAATAIAAHLYARKPRARVATAALSVVAAGVVAGCGGVWGFGFLALVAFVIGGAEARRRFLTLPAPVSEPDALPPIPGGAPSWLHGIAWFVLSILLMKEYVGQAMVVPTGSMQPTIMGARNGGAIGGDWLFVENFSYLFRSPGRWEIVVFQFPLFRERNFVKRVVGLPGEHLEIKDGDIWIDGKIARKPPIVQATMWRELFPRPGSVATPKKIVDGFESTGPWKPTSSDEMLASPTGTEPTFAQFKLKEPSNDLRLAFTAVPQGYAIAIARITTRGVPVELRIDAAGESGESTFAVGATRTSIANLKPRGGDALRLELCVADGQAWAVVDGREVARADVPVDGHGKSRVELGASTKPVSFRDVVVARDIVYDAGGGPGVYDVPKDGFFFIGDNVKESKDSRKWFVDVFHPPGGGEPVRGADAYPDENGNERSGMIRVEDGRYRFVDVDGVPRDLPKDGTKVEHNVPSPFARRDQILGRAVMIGWPWIPADAGFRPRLLP